MTLYRLRILIIVAPFESSFSFLSKILSYIDLNVIFNPFIEE